MTQNRGLSDEDLIKAFRRATSSVAKADQRWKERARQGLTDEQLSEALSYELGMIGGEMSDEISWLEYQGEGLKIWASKGWFISRHRDTPILQGADTIRMAREVYSIRDPSKLQLGLF